MIPVLAGLVLAMAACSKGSGSGSGDGGGTPPGGVPQTIPLPVVTGESLIQVGPNEGYTNAMGTLPGKLPVFPELAKKPGKVRGFVTDLAGKPVPGAFIGVRSSSGGGYYSSASTESDSKGYYEMEIPAGAAHYWAAGAAVEYAGSATGMGLYAADGNLAGFASATGEVEHFVLLSYGIADAADIPNRPGYSANYFGGSIHIAYQIGDPDDIWAPDGVLPPGSEIEIKLTPEGYFFYGETKSFIIRKKVGNLSCSINNLPVGKYKIEAKLTDGRALRLKAVGPQHPTFGMRPAETMGQASVTFIPNTGNKQCLPNRGDWNPVAIDVELP